MHKKEMEMVWMKFNYGCLAVILLIALAGAVSAADKGLIIVSDIQGMPGDTITMPIKLQNAADIGSMDFRVDMQDSYGLHIISIENGALTQDTLFAWMHEEGSHYARFSSASSKSITGSGTIAVVTFNVGNSVPEEMKKQGLKKYQMVVEGEVFDTNSKSIGFYKSYMDFTLGPALKGDGNHDGKVNSNDAMTALQIAIGKLPQNKDYDMNGDGVIKSNDVMEILKLSVTTSANVGGSLLAETPVSAKAVETGGSVQMWKP